MRPETAKRLLDARVAARRIRKFTAGLDFSGFSRSEMVRSAVERHFEIVGEALGKAAEVEPAVAEQIPDLRRVVGLRNRLIHGYDSVDDEIIWDIVQTKIPPLAAQLDHLLTESGFASAE